MARVISRRTRVGICFSIGLLLLLVLSPGRREELAAQATDPCAATPVNPIACENSKPGNPASEWDISGAGSAAIQGFATEISVNRGTTVGFKVSTTAASYRIDIYRLGFYNGLGARLQAQILNPTATNQAACTTQAATGLVDCGNWSQSASWAVPATAVSGIYIAKLDRPTPRREPHRVRRARRQPASPPLLFQTSDTTWQAYNTYGGNSLYAGSPAGRAYKVSYNRPFTTRGNAAGRLAVQRRVPDGSLARGQRLQRQLHDAASTPIAAAAELLEHKVFLSVGHDEYWSGAQRANVEAARAAGVHLAFFSGNEVFWKTRWENSIDGSRHAYRTLVSLQGNPCQREDRSG